MHMSDALISPAVGGTLWAGAAVAVTFSVRRLKDELEDKKIPLMGVMGAFVFAAQMINFTIPGTGSSGHIGGGMLLSILLGPYAGFLTMASVLLIQALLFADGGLLAFGCNLINLGLITCFVAYPLIYRTLTHKPGKKRIVLASVLSAVVSLQLGAFSVVLETYFSGKTELPFATFLLFMQPIHLVIGLVEGFVTATVLVFISSARPDLIPEGGGLAKKGWSYTRVLVVLLVIVLITGGLLSLYKSQNPDGLEWSVQNILGGEILKPDSDIHGTISEVQGKTAILPGYQLKNPDASNTASEKAGTSLSGIIGSVLTLGLVAAIAFLAVIIKKRRRSV